jgi:hypothetical protein
MSLPEREPWNNYWWSFMLKHGRDELRWFHICKNVNMSLDIIEIFFQGFWNATNSIILNYPGLSHNPNLTKEFVNKHIDKQWNLNDVNMVQNNDYCLTRIKENPNGDWEWYLKEKNAKKIMEMIDEDPDKEWNWHYISANTGILFSFIEKYIHKNWNWSFVSSSKYLTIEKIEQYPDKYWSWDYISQNQWITTIETIQKFPNKPWNWTFVSRCPSITMDIVEKNPQYKWSYNNGISGNPNLTLDFILKNKDKNWDFNFMSSNKGLTFEIIEYFPDKNWNWAFISAHKFEKMKETYIFKHEHKKYFWDNIFEELMSVVLEPSRFQTFEELGL